MFEQSMLLVFDDSIDFVNTMEQKDLRGGSIKPIIVVPIACIGDSVENNDKKKDTSISPSENFARRLSYDERLEEAETLDIGVDRNAEAVTNEVIEVVTPMEEGHSVVPEAQSYIEPVKSVQAVIDDINKEHQV
ncbi:hypothetical protein HAX54_009447 [Datura stramonium]|uniref:Uncharacterized protein n=1 Tax=Datura stramonium TaxID=4076 RepID=A0ABS8TGI1_DATST|nr:hypothetical protein [Datura stramonium]